MITLPDLIVFKSLMVTADDETVTEENVRKVWMDLLTNLSNRHLLQIFTKYQGKTLQEWIDCMLTPAEFDKYVQKFVDHGSEIRLKKHMACIFVCCKDVPAPTFTTQTKARAGSQGRCPITLEELPNEYMECRCCHCYFSGDKMKEWLCSRQSVEDRKCPCCRADWTEYVVFRNN